VEESPEFDLSPEHFLQAECGLKGRGHELAWQVSVWRTWIQGMIMRSPEDSTGSKVGKDNSNGWMHGIEVDLEWAFAPQWTATMMASWMNGEIEQRVGVDGVPFNQLAVVMAPVDRLMPLQAWLSARNTGSDGRFWYEGWLWSLGNADKLSFRDQRDGSRIPAGGTPGFTILGISAGWHLSSKLDFSLQLENLTDQDYRVHGSGINGAGRNLVAVIDLRF
jgi:hemoglobin/transferrin/lactoferrin receptor protein